MLEHTHIPTSRKSPFPGGGDLPRQYSHTLDPFISPGFGRGHSLLRNSRSETGICSFLKERQLSLQVGCELGPHVQQGLALGLAGLNMEEMEDHGVKYNRRFAMMKERVLAMKSSCGKMRRQSFQVSL